MSMSQTHAVPLNTMLADLDESLRPLVLAAREAVVNVAKHAGTQRADVYAETTGGAVDVFVRDRGAGFEDPFIGYGPAHGTDLSLGGMGLWLPRQLCDHVDISPDGDGVHVRLTTVLD